MSGKYKPEDRLLATDANRFDQTSIDFYGNNQQHKRAPTITATMPKAVPAYSCFGVGDAANPYDENLTLKISDPIEDSETPYYTNGFVATGADEIHVYPIGARPTKLVISGTIAVGDRAKPDTDGAAEKDDGGSLLCVSDSDNGHAMFIYSPMSAAPAHVHFTAPDDGIPAGGTVACTVISYSDGRDLSPVGPATDEMIDVFNWTSEAVCETASHEGHAEMWDGDWRLYNEDRVCEEELVQGEEEELVQDPLSGE